MLARIELGEGYEANMNTLRVMAAMADDGAESPTVRAFAAGVERAAGPRPTDQVRYLFNWLKARVRFVPDPPGRELVRSPASMIEEARTKHVASGDCDDRSTLGAAVLAALAIPPAFVIATKEAGGPFVHVLFAAKIGGEWVMLDPQSAPRPGVLPRRAVDHELHPIDTLRDE